MSFKLVVETDGKLAADGWSVLETFLGPDGSELPLSINPPHISPRRGVKIDERDVKRVRLFRNYGFGNTGPTDPNDGPRGRWSGFCDGNLPVNRTSALLLVAVPAEVSMKGLHYFFDGSLEECVETLRVFRWVLPDVEDDSEGKSGDFYAVLLLCRTQATADSLYQAYHGRIIGTARPVSSGYDALASSGCEKSVGGPCCYMLFLEGIEYHAEKVNGVSCQVPQTVVELPMCPFCLERLDISVTGMITHNAGWLSSMEWDEVPFSRCCPSCAAIDRAGRILSRVSEGPVPACQTCESCENLWVCLVCGHLGCGRYALGHAKDHARDRGHNFCLDLSSGRIWHYARDVFVHRRLVQMFAATGRFEVALPDPVAEAMPSDSGAGDRSGKGPEALHEDHLAMELDAVLASQLEHQRSQYESKLRAQDEQQRKEIDDIRKQIDAQEPCLRLLAAEIAEALGDERRLERKLASAENSLANVSKELEFVREVNASMLANRAEMHKHSSSAATAAKSSGLRNEGKDPEAEEEDPFVLRLEKKLANLIEMVSNES